MRVLFLTHSFPRAVGDAPGSFLLRLARALAERSVAVQVVAPSAPDLPRYDELDGIPVTRFRYAPHRWETLAYTGNMAEDVRRSLAAKVAMGSFLLAAARATGSAVRTFRPAVVHAHWWFPAGLVATLPSSGSAPPVVTTLHGTDVRLARSIRPAAALLRRVTRQSAATTAVSRYLAQEAAALTPGLPAPRVAPMPAATELFQPPPAGRPRSGVLFVGRLNAQKGIDPLLRAFARLRHASTLDVVGDGPERERLRGLARSLGLEERVRWHGALPQQRLPDFYARSAVVAVPSVDEGLGLVAVEALLCETPVVGYESGGLPDVVEDGVSGHLVAPGSAESLASAIDRVLGDAVYAAALGRKGRARTLATFSPERVADRYREIYEEAAAVGGTGTP